LKYKIAIDGPAGAGKSTIAKLLAKKLGFIYIDSGAMYRAVTLYMLRKELLKLGEKILLKNLKKLQIQFKNNGQTILLNNKNVSKNIRSSNVNKYVSEVSAMRVVRKEMVKRQKEFGRTTSVVMDGRDIGTVVFKDANLKVYLTASVEERAIRRKKDFKKLGENLTLDDLKKNIQARDDYDSFRKISPLSKAHDAIIIDTSKLTVDQVLNKIMLLVPIRSFS